MSGLRHDRQTIMDLIRALEPGGLLQLEPGEHRECLVIDRPMTLRGAGSSTLLQGVPRSGPVIDVRARGVQIESLVLEHLDVSGVVIRVLPGAEVELKRVRNLAGRVEGACVLEAVPSPPPLPTLPRVRPSQVSRAQLSPPSPMPLALQQPIQPPPSPAPTPSLESARTLESRLEPAPGLLFEGMEPAAQEGGPSTGRKTSRSSPSSRSGGVRATSRGKKSSEGPVGPESGQAQSSATERVQTTSKAGSSLVEAQGLGARPMQSSPEKAALSVRAEGGVGGGAGPAGQGTVSTVGASPTGLTGAVAGQLVLPGLPPLAPPSAVQAVQGLLTQVAAAQAVQATGGGSPPLVAAPTPTAAPAPASAASGTQALAAGTRTRASLPIRTPQTAGTGPGVSPQASPQATAGSSGGHVLPLTPASPTPSASRSATPTGATPTGPVGSAAGLAVGGAAQAGKAGDAVAGSEGAVHPSPRTSGERKRAGSTTARRTGPGRAEGTEAPPLRVESELLVSEGPVDGRRASSPSVTSDPGLPKGTSTPASQAVGGTAAPRGAILRRRPVQPSAAVGAASTVLSVAMPPGPAALGTSGPLSNGDSPVAVGAPPQVQESGRGTAGRGASERLGTTPATVGSARAAEALPVNTPPTAGTGASRSGTTTALPGKPGERQRLPDEQPAGGALSATQGKSVASQGGAFGIGSATPSTVGSGVAGVGMGGTSAAGASAAGVSPVSVQTVPQAIPASSTLAGAPLTGSTVRVGAGASPTPGVPSRQSGGRPTQDLPGVSPAPVTGAAPAPASARAEVPREASRAAASTKSPALAPWELELRDWLRLQGERWSDEAIWIELVRRMAGRPQVPAEDLLRARARQLFEQLQKERRESEARALEMESLRERWLRRCWEALIRLPKGGHLETAELTAWRAQAGDEQWREERLATMARTGLVAALEPGNVVQLHYAPWGELQVVRRGALQIWDASDHAPRWFLPVASDKAAVSADGKTFALALGSTLELMNGPTRLRLLDIGDEALSLAVAPSGEFVAAASASGSLQIWRVADGEAILHADALQKPLHALAFTPDGAMLVGADARGRILRWRLPNGEALQVLETGTEMPAALAISPDGMRLVARDARSFAVFTCEGGVLTRSWRQGVGPGVEELNPPSLPLAFLPDGGHVVSLTSSGALGIWQLSRGRLLREFSLPERPTAVAVRAGGAELAVAQGLQGIVCVAIDSGQLRRRIGTEPSPVLTARFVEGGRTLRVRASDGSTRLYEVTRLRPLPTDGPSRSERQEGLLGDGLLGQELSISHAAIRLYLPPPGGDARKLRLV